MPAKPPESAEAELPAPRDAADAARDRGDHPTAAALYRRHLRLFPTDAAIWVQLGHMLKETGDLAGAEAAYLDAIALEPDCADTHLQLGHAHKLVGAIEAAQQSYARALRLDPDCADARAEIAALVAQRLAAIMPGAAGAPGVAELRQLLGALAASQASTYGLFQRAPFAAAPAQGVLA